MKIISWNVNGIRACINKDFVHSVMELDPDVICIQETKARPEQVEYDFSEMGYDYAYWNSAEKKGYSGTLILSKEKPISISYGMGIEQHDQEGRIITVEFDSIYLTTVYTPNSKRGLLRLDYRQKDWDVEYLNMLKKLEQKKPVIACGDFNVAPQPMDLTNPKPNERNAGFTIEEREGFTNFIKAGFIDSFRHLYPDKIQYTWWSYMGNARSKNIGWRIDHFLVSDALKDRLKDCKIHDQIMGSDHCPIELIIN